MSWISYINRALDASVSATSEVSSMTAANVIDEHLATVWMSTATSSRLVLDLGANYNINVVGVFGTSFTTSANWQIMMSTAAAGLSDVLGTGFVSMNVPEGYGQAVYVTNGTKTTRYITFDFQDFASTTGYFTVGEVWAGPAFEPEYDFSFPYGQGGEDGHTVSQSRGGQEYIDERWERRVASFSLGALTLAESWEQVQEMRRLCGRKKSVLIVPETGTYMNREAIMGLLSEHIGVSRTNHNKREVGFTIKERL